MTHPACPFTHLGLAFPGIPNFPNIVDGLSQRLACQPACVRKARDLSSLQCDLDLPLEDQFGPHGASTLILHASEDLNVPVDDAFDAVRALWAAGNRDVELRILPAGSHSFQFDAEDYETRVQEKIIMQNFARPLDPCTRPSSSTTWRTDSPDQGRRRDAQTGAN